MQGKTCLIIPLNSNDRIASMRPPRNAGENSACGATVARLSTCFNEAPAKCRGKQIKDAKAEVISARFNEAPAKCRGKPANRS